MQKYRLHFLLANIIFNLVVGLIVTLSLFFLFAEFDLEKEKSLLDEQGLRIAENQENSQKNRRKLAESTRGMTLHKLYLNNEVQYFSWERRGKGI